MIALLLVLAGLAIIVGARGAAGKLLRLAFGLVLVVSVWPVLSSSGEAFLANSLPEWRDSLGLVLVGVIALALVGYILWHRRANDARAEEAAQRRHHHPRRRALPPAPPEARASPEGEEEHWS